MASVASDARSAAPLICVGALGAPARLLLADTDVCARLIALAAQVLRERLPELLHRHALAAAQPRDALALAAFALQHAQLFARVLDMSTGVFVPCVQWLCAAQNALLSLIHI